MSQICPIHHLIHRCWSLDQMTEGECHYLCATPGWHVWFLNEGPRIWYLCRMRHMDMSEDRLYLA